MDETTRQILTVVSGIVLVTSAMPYLIDTLRDSTRPNVVTWFTWSLINGINAVVATADGAWQTAVFAYAATIATTSITLAGLRHGLKQYTVFDAVCQAVALLGIPLWLTTGQPELAILMLLIVDFAGGLPTLRHAWRLPHEETWQTFALSASGGALLLLTLERFDMVALTMPLYIFLFDSTILGMIFYRRRIARRPVIRS